MRVSLTLVRYLQACTIWSCSSDSLRITSVPAGAPGVNGGPLGANYAGQGGWAIRKDRGPWRDLFAWTQNYTQPSEVCLNLLERYNLDPLVTANRNGHVPAIPLVTCMAQSVFTGGVSWGETGPSVNDDCRSESLLDNTDPNGSVDALGWVNSAIDCIRENVVAEVGSLPHSITFHHRGSNSFSTPFEVVLPSGEDPKLVPMPRTALLPGLYEILVLMDNGTLFRRSEEFTQLIVLEASFASFVDISIYPVPVMGRTFAINLEIDYPLSVSVSVVSNTGAPMHQAQLAFNLSGKHKHVVTMLEPWPTGLYHAVFQYADGSSESLSFTVEH